MKVSVNSKGHGRQTTYTREEGSFGKTQAEPDGEELSVVLNRGGTGREDRPQERAAGKVDAGANTGEKHVGRDLTDHVTIGVHPRQSRLVRSHLKSLCYLPCGQDRNRRVEVGALETEILLERTQTSLAGRG